MKKVIIIGGNAAGMSAASQIKRKQPDWDVTVYERGQFISYAACGIPYHVQGLFNNLDDLITVTPRDARDKRNINLKLNHDVTAIDAEDKKITVKGPEDVVTDNFDFLVIATGAGPMKTTIEYTPSERIYNVHTLDDSVTLRQLVESGKIKNCAVIGGGYIALEMLEALKDRGFETHLIHRREDLSRSFEKEISNMAKEEMDKEDIILHLGQSVKKITENDGSVLVHTDRETLHFDLVVVGAGVEPNNRLARDCGIQTGAKGSIKVNENMQTNFSYIYAAGDCTETKNQVSGKAVFVPLALKANKEGIVAGVNISGGNEKFPGVMGTAITKFFNLGLARTGLTLAEAEESGFDATKFSVTSGTKSHYYPGAGSLTSILIADKKDGRLLGAQLAGPTDGVKRIDVYVTAITARMTLEDIFQLDLAYAPPFSPVYDPVVLAGRVGRKKVR